MARLAAEALATAEEEKEAGKKQLREERALAKLRVRTQTNLLYRRMTFVVHLFFIVLASAEEALNVSLVMNSCGITGCFQVHNFVFNLKLCTLSTISSSLFVHRYLVWGQLATIGVLCMCLLHR
jgi:hypothetical protein